MQLTTEQKLLSVLMLLLAITAATWLTTAFDLLSSKVQGLAILLLAFVKVRLIIIHYMEAYKAPLVLRLGFELWLIVACLGTLWFDYL